MKGPLNLTFIVFYSKRATKKDKMSGSMNSGSLKKKSKMSQKKNVPCYHAHVDKDERKEKELVRCTDETCPKDGSNGCEKSHAPEGVSFHWCNFGTSCKRYNMKTEKERAEEMDFSKATKTLKMSTRDVDSATEALGRHNKMLADVLAVPAMDTVKIPVFKDTVMETSLPANAYKLKGVQNANKKLQDAVEQWQKTHDEHSSLLDEIDSSPEKLIMFLLSKLADTTQKVTTLEATVANQSLDMDAQAHTITALQATTEKQSRDIADFQKLLFSLLAKTANL